MPLRPLVQPPDLLLISGRWPERALLRAQLIEEGWKVAAYESFADAASWLTGDARPKVAVIEAETPQEIETLVRALGTDHIVALTSAQGLDRGVLEWNGVRAILTRPFSVADVVAAVRRAMR